MTTTTRAPGHLAAPTRAWFRAVLADYELESHHVKLLESAAACWDRAEEARATICAAGPYYTDARGVKRAHPAIGVKLANRNQFSRLIRALGLDIEPPRAPGRPGGR